MEVHLVWYMHWRYYLWTKRELPLHGIFVSHKIGENRKKIFTLHLHRSRITYCSWQVSLFSTAIVILLQLLSFWFLRHHISCQTRHRWLTFLTVIHVLLLPLFSNKSLSLCKHDFGLMKKRRSCLEFVTLLDTTDLVNPARGNWVLGSKSGNCHLPYCSAAISFL